jgi:ABC-type polysaccharide/polyol phosphate transport system ATPase subunit/SAM-dependent methyltransferase
MSVALEAQDLSMRFLLRHTAGSALKVRFLGLFHRAQRDTLEAFWALKGVSLGIARGEAIGLIGRNGSGKSTLLKILSGIYRPTTGRVLVARRAKIGSMIELGVGFHYELTARENVFLNAAIHGLSRPHIESLYEPIVEYSGLRQFMDTPLKNLSSGMRLRLGYAVLAHLDPDIILLDEIFAVGDEDFQRQCLQTIHRFQEVGKTIVFVSHAVDSIRAICRRGCLLEAGELIYDGELDGAFNRYQRLLLRERPRPLRGSEIRACDGATGEPVGAVAQGMRLATELTDEELAPSWHRVVNGGLWNELGDLQFDFMRREGLQPSHYLLDVGCGCLRGGTRFIPYLDPGHYVGLDKSRELVRAGIEIELARLGIEHDRAEFLVNDSFDLSEVPFAFDYALGQELFTGISLNAVARCIAMVVRRLTPGGRFYTSYYENPDPESFKPFVHAGGYTSYPDQSPYHYDFATLARLCEALGARAERIGEWGHPRGAVMMVITRGSEPIPGRSRD